MGSGKRVDDKVYFEEEKPFRIHSYEHRQKTLTLRAQQNHGAGSIDLLFSGVFYMEITDTFPNLIVRKPQSLKILELEERLRSGYTEPENVYFALHSGFNVYYIGATEFRISREPYQTAFVEITFPLFNRSIVFYRTNLVGADLSGMNLHRAFMENMDLNRADLRGTSLNGARMFGANLQEANLTNGNLANADLRQSNLTRAVLRKVIAYGTQLQEAKLIGANFEDASVGGADFSGADLSGSDIRCVQLERAKLTNAQYDGLTKWPSGFRPEKYGAVRKI